MFTIILIVVDGGVGEMFFFFERFSLLDKLVFVSVL